MMNDERTMTEGSMPETASTPVASRPTTVLRALRSGGGDHRVRISEWQVRL
jgi:hypothetical protein